MAWNDATITRAANLWASMWTISAIAAVLGFRRGQVRAAFRDLRQREDARIERADFIRKMAVAHGVRETTIEDIRTYLNTEEFMAGLKRSLMEGGGMGPPPLKGEDA